MKVTGVSLVQKNKKDLESCSNLSDTDIFRGLRCEASICEFLPGGKKVGEGLKYCTLAMVFNHFTVKGIIRKLVHQSRGAETSK